MTSTRATGVRVVELPACTMCAASGPDLAAFDAWWTAVDAVRADRPFPRDFMYHDSARDQLVWMYALPPEARADRPYPLVEFAGGLYAAAASRDQDDVDGERVYGEIQAWVRETGAFELDERPDRSSLFHVITPDSAYRRLGYRQLDIYVPIR